MEFISNKQRFDTIGLHFNPPEEWIKFMKQSNYSGGIFKNKIDNEKQIELLNINECVKVMEGLQKFYGPKESWDSDWRECSYFPIIHLPNKEIYLCYDYSLFTGKEFPILMIYPDEFPLTKEGYEDFIVANSLEELLKELDDIDFWVWKS